MKHCCETREVYVAYYDEYEELCWGEADTLKDALRFYGYKDVHHINREVDEYEDGDYIETVETETVWRKGDEI